MGTTENLYLQMDDDDGSQRESLLSLQDRLGSRRVLRKEFASPYQRWREYGQLPTKAILNVILTILTTAQVIVIHDERQPYQSSTAATFKHFLMPNDEPVYTIQDLKSRLNDTVQSYYRLPAVSIDYYGLVPTWNNKVVINVSVAMLNSDADTRLPSNYNFMGNVHTDMFFATADEPFGTTSFTSPKTTSFLSQPETNPGWRKKMDHLLWVSLSMQIKDIFMTANGADCYSWNVTVKYYASSGFVDKTGQLKPLFQADGNRCPLDDGWVVDLKTRTPLSVLYGTILFLAILCLILHIRTAITKPKRVLDAFRGIVQNSPEQLRRGSINAGRIEEAVHNSHIEVAPGFKVPSELQFFNMWNVITITSNLLQITSSAICIMDMNLNGGYVPIQWAVLVVGTTAMVSWVNLVQYLEYDRKYYILITALRLAAPQALRYLLCAFLLFMGYTLFGLCVFSGSEKFATLDNSAVTLFAVLNGDVILETFQDLYPINQVVSRLFMYTFICLFMYVVLNIFISIVEEAYYKGLSMDTDPAVEDDVSEASTVSNRARTEGNAAPTYHSRHHR